MHPTVLILPPITPPVGLVLVTIIGVLPHVSVLPQSMVALMLSLSQLIALLLDTPHAQLAQWDTTGVSPIILVLTLLPANAKI